MKKTIITLIVFSVIYWGWVYLDTLISPDSKSSEKQEVVVVDDRAVKIDNYFKERNMPLEGYGKKMVEVADANGLDWRLLPAISIRESSGGKQMCENNPFGWGSCKITFKSLDEAIETVGYKLANLPVYKGKTTEQKLYYYNGTVIATYPAEVLAIMTKIAL